MPNKIKRNKKKLKVIAAIQARIGSTRLPGKVLEKIAGKAMVERIFEQLKACEEIDAVVLAIPDNKQNDKLAAFARKVHLPYCRGSEQDLIARHYKAAKQFGADALARVTADCPLMDPDVVDELARAYRKGAGDFDFFTNNLISTFPHGLEIEIFPIKTLEWLDREVKNPLHREWLSCYIFERPKEFRIYNLQNKPNLSSERWTVDFPEDLKFVNEIFNGLGKSKKIFHIKDVLKFLEKNPAIRAINAIRKEKAIVAGIRSKEYYEIKDRKI